MASIAEQCARVDQFARLMKEQLRRNAAKGDWRDCDGENLQHWLLARAWEKLEAVDAAVSGQADCETLGPRCADVANYLFMIVDVAGMAP